MLIKRIAVSRIARRRFFGGLTALSLLAAAVLYFTFNPRTLAVLSSADERRELPVIMYHSLLRDPERAGKYVISPEQFERDIEWLLKNGYTPVLISDVISFVSGTGELPLKPVAITLDDGYLNNALYLPDILEKLNICVTIAVVGEYTELYTVSADANPNYGYMTWDDIRSLAQSQRVEIANHSYFSHSSVPKDAKKRDAYAKKMAEDAAQMQAALLANSGVIANVYAYPYGLMAKGWDALLMEIGIKATLSCNEGVNIIRRGHTSDLFSMKRVNRPAGISTEQFMEKALR